jgi:endonuclease G
MPQRDFPGNLDPFLQSAFETAEEAREEGGLETIPPPPELPFLVRVYDPRWTPPMNRGFVETSRVGTVVAGRGTREGLAHLLADPGVHSVEGSRSGGPAGEECVVSVPFVRGTAVHAGPPGERGDSAIVAVIDNGIDVLHEAFRDPSGKKTRILAVWDQTDSSGKPKAGKYGTVHEQADIDGYLAHGLPAGSGLSRYRHPGPAGHHGTHVAGIAAGRAAGACADGMAPDARIVFVIPNLDVAPGKPESVGYSNSHVDALDFIAELANKHQLPVVVNVSQGMNAGAHDGTSTLEAAFDGFTGRGLIPGRAVVKSAGNERGYRGHAFLTLAQNTVEELAWQSKPILRKEDLIELWFRACDEFEFRLHGPVPGWAPSPWVTRAAPTLTHPFASGNRAQITLQRYCDDNGDSRLAIRILAGTAAGIDAGEWKLEIQSRTIKARGEIHAWVERINSRPTEFRGPFVNDDLTVSIPGTAHSVITVAAVGSTAPYKVASFSSIGPCRDRREKPTLAAPGMGIRAAMKGTASGNDAMSGTSMAAPHVAGAVALLFSDRARKVAQAKLANPASSLRQLNANQVLAALGQVTQNFSGRWTPTMGYGVLDAEALLKTFT